MIDQASTDISAFTKRLDPMLASGEQTLQVATETLTKANGTLANLDQALNTAESALSAAERTFVDAEAIITTDLGPAISDVRTAAGQFETTMATLSKDIPE